MFSIFSSGQKSVAGVLSVFSKAIDDLEVVQAEQLALADSHAVAIAQATAAHRDALTEAYSAKDVMAKMLAIITPTPGYASGGYVSGAVPLNSGDIIAKGVVTAALAANVMGQQ